MGLVSDGSNYAVLTDIAGQEDHYGDMDFKVAGSRKGITALQMDIKVSGLSRQILEQALEQAHRARNQLLDAMQTAIAEPRSDISPYAPRIFQIKIDVDQIRNVIGPGGKTIRSIIDALSSRPRPLLRCSGCTIVSHCHARSDCSRSVRTLVEPTKSPVGRWTATCVNRS